MPDQGFAVVTGASSGIGLELARQFLENGFDVLITAEDEELAAARAELAATPGEPIGQRSTWCALTWPPRMVSKPSWLPSATDRWMPWP